MKWRALNATRAQAQTDLALFKEERLKTQRFLLARKELDESTKNVLL